MGSVMCYLHACAGSWMIYREEFGIWVQSGRVPHVHQLSETQCDGLSLSHVLNSHSIYGS